MVQNNTQAVLNKAYVLEKAEQRIKIMTWKDAVINAINRSCRARRRDIFTRQDLINNELAQIVIDTCSKGATPDQTLSRILQELRELGLIELLNNNGTYRKLWKNG